MKKIKILSYAKVQSVIMLYVGLLAGLIYSIGGLLIDSLVSIGWISSQETPGLSYGTFLAFGALIGMPIIFALFGFITGIIGAHLYNITSKWLPEINMDFKPI